MIAKGHGGSRNKCIDNTARLQYEGVNILQIYLIMLTFKLSLSQRDIWITDRNQRS